MVEGSAAMAELAELSDMERVLDCWWDDGAKALQLVDMAARAVVVERSTTFIILFVRCLI